MAFDETLAARVRANLGGRDVTERKMFGGLAFLLGGHMCCGVQGQDLMVRVSREDHPAALREPGARPMDFTGKPLQGMVYVGPAGIESEAQLAHWVEHAVAYAASLPPKSAGSRSRKKRRVG